MTPAECHIGQLVRIDSTAGRIWRVVSLDAVWAELHADDGSRCDVTIGMLVPVEPVDALPPPDWQERLLADVMRSEPEPEPTRQPTVLCWLAIAAAIAFLGLHVWAAIRFGCGASGLDPIGAAVALVSSGVGWTAWFATLLWVTRVTRRQK